MLEAINFSAGNAGQGSAIIGRRHDTIELMPGMAEGLC
jgi:hypothetical protein